MVGGQLSDIICDMSGVGNGKIDLNGGMSPEVEIVIPADVAHVAFVRTIVSAVAELEPALDENRIYDLAMVVTEATTNAIKAHQSAGLTHPVRVWCRAYDNTVTVVIHDEGPGFDPGSLPEMPSPESQERLYHESGLGVALIQMLSDESEIRSGPDGTEVRLILHASPPHELSASTLGANLGGS